MKPRKSFFPNGFDIDMAPFQDFVKRMDSFFNDSFRHLNSHFNLKSFTVNTYETKSNVIVEAELPGYNRDQIKIDMLGNHLRIEVEDKAIYEESNDEDHSYKTSQSFRKLERVVTLPFSITEKDTKATFENGLLKVIIPKKEIDRKRIDIMDHRKE